MPILHYLLFHPCYFFSPSTFGHQRMGEEGGKVKLKKQCSSTFEVAGLKVVIKMNAKKFLVLERN